MKSFAKKGWYQFFADLKQEIKEKRSLRETTELRFLKVSGKGNVEKILKSKIAIMLWQRWINGANILIPYF